MNFSLMHDIYVATLQSQRLSLRYYMHATRLPCSHGTVALPLLHLIKIQDQILERKNLSLGISDGMLNVHMVITE